MLPKKDNIFGIPAIVTKEKCLNQEYMVIFMLDNKEEQAFLQRIFLTAIEKDGVAADWEDVKSCLKVGSEIKVDVTQCRSFSSNAKWLVFGLYLGGSQSERRNESPCFQRMNYSKEFDWIQKFSKGVQCEKPSLKSLETKLANIEANVFNYSTELDNTEKALVDDRESLDNAKIEAAQVRLNTKNSPKHMNKTFTLDDSVEKSPSPTRSSRECQHQYEVGIVVISVEEQQLQMVGPMNNIWVKIDVNSDCVPVFVERSRVFNFREVKVGFMGTVIMAVCVNCQLDKKVESLTTPLFLWLGEEPDVRGESGVVVWSEDDKMLVMVDGGQPVMFRGCGKDEIVATDEKVIVWAWSTRPGMCAEGAIWLLQQSDAENLVVPASEVSLPKVGLDEVSLGTDIESVEEDHDKSSDISFGSVSECSEIDMNKSVNTNLSTLLKFSPFKRCNISYPEDKNSNPCCSSFHDEEIEREFEEVMSANDLANNLDNLVDKYEDYYQASQAPRVVKRHAVDIPETSEKNTGNTQAPRVVKRHAVDVPVTSEKNTGNAQCSPLSLQVDLLENPTEVSPPSFFTRRLSSSPLSPIPEETTENGMPSTPLCKSRDDSGYNGSFWSGCNIKGKMNPVPVTPDTKKPPVCSLFATPPHKAALEQFLEFTDFPATRRDDLINQFISSLKETE